MIPTSPGGQKELEGTGRSWRPPGHPRGPRHISNSRSLRRDPHLSALAQVNRAVGRCISRAAGLPGNSQVCESIGRSAARRSLGPLGRQSSDSVGLRVEKPVGRMSERGSWSLGGLATQIIDQGVVHYTCTSLYLPVSWKPSPYVRRPRSL